MSTDTYTGIKDNDAFQRWTKRKNTMGLVILFLFTYEEDTHLGIVDHILNLLLTTRRVKRNGTNSHSVCSKISI